MTDIQIQGTEQILAGTITDASISASAAIAQSKLALAAQILLATGAIAMTANFNGGGNLYNNLANGVASTDAVNLGQVEALITANGLGFVDQGAWSNTTAYAVNNVVQFGGSVYNCIVANTGEEPDTSPSYWNLWLAAPPITAPAEYAFSNSGSPLTAYSFTLPNTPAAGTRVSVFLDGTRIPATAFSVSGAVVTIGSSGTFTGMDGISYTVAQFRGGVIEYSY